MKAQQKVISKQRIINVASRLFKTNGYSATGIDQIMQEAGLTAGGFYAHFRSKSHLLEQSLEHSLNKSRELLLKGTENLSGPEKNKVIMKKYVSLIHRDLVENGCVIPALGAEIYRVSKKNKKIVENYLSSWVDILVENMHSDETHSEKRKKAFLWISQSVGAILLSRVTNELSMSDEWIDSIQVNF
ncbi:MAG: TetR/AcrR family transcriptional regulator [Pseudobdellovibrio sp.]